VLNAPERLATAVPGYTQAVQERIERSSTAERELAKLGGSSAPAPTTEADEGAAPEIRGIETWLNTPGSASLTLAGLRGRVVLVDFWTYSCINCLRTLPHLKAWDAAYRDAGLTIVGVHSPEFAFERAVDNVRSAVRRLGIRYPVALDNDFATWRAYSNRYWPAKYLVDRSGRVRYHHFGEGAYEDTERRIRALLGPTVTAAPASRDPGISRAIRTPESYLGYERLTRFANGSVAPDVEGERIVAGRGARLVLRFQAKDILLVLEGEGHVEVDVDGRSLRTVRVLGLPRLYTIARFPALDRGLLELRFSRGVAGYAFTFG
jgi:thiol-disulfide isomerase/thioredoxin